MKLLVIVSVICAVLAVAFIGAILLSGIEINISYSEQGQKTNIDVNIGFSLPNPNYSPNTVPYATPEVTATSSSAHPETNNPTVTQTSNPTVSPTKTPTLTATQTVKPTLTPTKTPTLPVTQTVKPTLTPTKTPTPVPTPTISPLEQEGINKIVGNWYGTKSMIIGSATFSARFNSDHTASIDGKAETIGGTRDISLGNLKWRYQGNNQFIGTTNGKTLIFICDGNTLTTTVNPHKLGSSGNSYPDLDISVEMHRV